MRIKIFFLFISTALLLSLRLGENDAALDLAKREPTDPFAEIAPKYELRAAWVTTFTNLDWPSQRGLTAEEQKAEFCRLLDEFQMNKINCVIVQIRASGDAFYPSKYAPWSEYLTGTQGKSPGYDPLQFMVQECHKRNMEFHAWLNPFRAVSSIKFSNVSDGNMYKKHPDWFFTYGQSIYFNPGIKEVRQHILNIIGEVVHNYDVDAIHFDDYFYPYSVEGENISDTKTYEKNKKEFTSIHDWRRNNINELIRETAKFIKFTKSHVKFGVSPLAIWRNIKQDPLGSQTASAQTSYDNLYCDTKKWIEKGWVDYVVPQLYWSIKSQYTGYNNLLQWWTSHPYKGHIYIGQALYRLEDTNVKHRFSVNEVLDQIKLNRKQEAVHGNIFFRAKTFRNNPQNIQDSLQKGLYKHFALIPPMKWI
ncbi:MAG: glycoside hydrolase family 10 protein, partial [Flavobacteriales bacterium]